TGMVVVMGEITTECYIDIPGIVRKTLKNIGYDSPEAGFDGNTCAVLTAIDEQSPDIAMGTNDKVGGAGDQGMMFGYACNETHDLMPLPITLANRMAYRLAQKRKDGTLPYILPDGKTQVTVEYDEAGKPIRIDTVVVSTQHKESVFAEELGKPILDEVITPVLDELKESCPEIDVETYNLYINPTGRFVKGGPAADSGLTGRKIIVDTYGGYAAHGGGAFSGKDPTKVDRSAAYAARHIAKNIVAAGLADKCQVQLAYAIGVPEPVSIRVDMYGTGKYSEQVICDAVEKVFDLTPAGIINRLKLRSPIYSNTAAYGHFGDVTGDERAWEKTDMVDALKEAIAEATE
ncbi:MAG: methionine adenosyltransferase, partial [Clostridia bacterium]|nr:methionine adenosyltransferase [Clostridia bacterium]